MKAKSKLIVFILVILLLTAGTLGYLWHTNRGPFQGDSVSGLPNGHFRVLETEPGHFDLLFAQHGSVSFHHYGEQVSLYLAHYAADELILHELVTRISTVGGYELKGSMLWGLTTEENRPRELRARLTVGGAMSQNYFDFSSFDFVIAATTGPAVTEGPIEQGRRYALQTWGTDLGIIPADGNVFDPDILRNSAHTAILYIVFE